MAFHYFEDFSGRDEQNHSYRISIENHSSYSHGHAQIFNQGEYRITLNGNKHFLTTPLVRDFRMEMDMNFVFRKIDFGYGFIYYFRYNRLTMTGHTLEMKFSMEHLLQIILDGKTVGEKKYAEMPSFEKVKGILEVNGTMGKLSFLGETYSFEIPEKDFPAKGEVGFDLEFSPGSIGNINKIVLDSPDACEKKLMGKQLDFELSTIQGMTVPAKYHVILSSYGDGYAEIDCVLDGTIRGRGDRDDGGTHGWVYENDRMTSPYIRIESEGKEFLNIYFKNGELIILDRDQTTLANRRLDDLKWPLHTTLVCRDFPEDYIVAAGYEYEVHKPWCFCSNGPWEQIRDKNNNLIYEGPSLRRERVGVSVYSPENKMLVSRIPKDIPMYEQAVKHAREQHYFYDDEKISFLLAVNFRKAYYMAEEFRIECEVQDPYGKAVPGVKTALSMAELPIDHESFDSVAKLVSVDKCLSSGIYHLKIKVTNGIRDFFDDVEVFEILPEDPDALPPPLASGLPMILSMNNEIKNLESDAFDPLGGWGGMGHYYTLVMRYPYIANQLKIWKILKVYHRKWHLMLTKRNSGDLTFSETNKELLRHADFVDMDMADWGSCIGSIFLYRMECHCGPVLEILRKFIEEYHPALKYTTVEKIDALLAADDPGDPMHFSPTRHHLTPQQFGELVDVCWNEWIDYVTAAIRKLAGDFGKKFLALNPKIGRGSYGPSSLYVQNYKSAYGARLAVRAHEYDEGTNANGSYFFVEEYHLSCDYTIVRSSFFLANCKLMVPQMRKLFPEIYYGGGLGCNDGAVYQAHPPFGIYNAYPQHQRTIVYTFAYATPYFKNGKYDYWRDYGFHCPTPGKKTLGCFIDAWGNLLRNKPATQLPASFFCFDFELFRKLGDYFEDEYNYHIPGHPEYDWGDVDNTGEEALAYAFIEFTNNGCNTPVQTTFAELDKLTKEQAPFIVIPPVVKGVSEKTVKSIRAAHERGIHILAFEVVAGLEDLFGVKEMETPVNLRRIGKEVFHHKMANARYQSAGADVVMTGAALPDGNADIPVLFTHTTKYGKTALFNVAPTTVKREDYRAKLSCGQATISEEMHKAMMTALRFLDPDPVVHSELGMINACLSEKGDVIVTVCGCTRAYGVTDVYPRSFRFKVSYPGIEKAEIETKAPCVVVSKGKDFVVVRTETEIDAGLFFRFIIK